MKIEEKTIDLYTGRANNASHIRQVKFYVKYLGCVVWNVKIECLDIFSGEIQYFAEPIEFFEFCNKNELKMFADDGQWFKYLIGNIINSIIY